VEKGMAALTAAVSDAREDADEGTEF
jgi:hypothetical protein